MSKNNAEGTHVVTVSIEVRDMIDKLIQHETRRTGYQLKSRDVIGRAVRELLEKLGATKSQTKKVKKQKWTPEQREKFKASMAAKKNKPVGPIEKLELVTTE